MHFRRELSVCQALNSSQDRSQFRSAPLTDFCMCKHIVRTRVFVPFTPIFFLSFSSVFLVVAAAVAFGMYVLTLQVDRLIRLEITWRFSLKKIITKLFSERFWIFVGGTIGKYPRNYHSLIWLVRIMYILYMFGNRSLLVLHLIYFKSLKLSDSGAYNTVAICKVSFLCDIAIIDLPRISFATISIIEENRVNASIDNICDGLFYWRIKFDQLE